MPALIPFFPPVKIDLPFVDFSVHGFGIAVAVGLWLGANMAMDKAKRDGLNPDIINRVVTWMIFGILFGGHLGHVFFYAQDELAKRGWTYIFEFWDGSSSLGGMIFTSFLCWLFFFLENKKIQKENRARRGTDKPLLFPIKATHYGDCVIYGFPMAMGLGRVGCFMAHDHPGVQTDFWLGVSGICTEGKKWAKNFPGGTCPDGWAEADGLCYNLSMACHDLGFYEAIWVLSLILVVRYLDKKKARFQGFFLAIVPMCYAPVRFFLDSLRTNDIRYYGLTPAQYGAIGFFILGFSLFLWLRKTTPVRELTKDSKMVHL